MCGRYALTTAAKDLAQRFSLRGAPEFAPRFNVAPTQVMPVLIRSDDGSRQAEMMRWGLIPFWAKDDSIGNRLINARSESVAEKPAFRAAMKRRRCLVPVDAFYEWQKLNGGTRKQPHAIRMADESTFAFAGLWEQWSDDGEGEVLSYTILTTKPNEALTKIHNRMPVILDPADYDAWLDPNAATGDELRRLFEPFPAEQLEMYPVSTHVNSPRNDDASCIAPMNRGPAPPRRQNYRE